MTVVLALLGMVIVPIDIMISMGVGVMLVVFTTLLTAAHLLPAIIGLLGDRVNALRVPFVGRAAAGARTAHEGVWERLSHSIMRRPVIWLGRRRRPAGARRSRPHHGHGIPRRAPHLPNEHYAKQGWNILDRDFSLGQVYPVKIVIDGRLTRPPSSTASTG